MKSPDSKKFDYAQSNWRQSIAVKIASQITWLLIPAAFIASIFLFGEMDEYIVQNFEYKVDSLSYRITGVLFNNADLEDIEKDVIINTIASELGFAAVKVITSEYKLDPDINVSGFAATTRTVEIGFNDGFENSFIVVTGYHDPVTMLLKKTHKNILASTIVFLTTLAALLVFTIRQKIYKPLNLLVNATEAAARGDKIVELDTARNDEFGHLAIFFKEMLSRLNEQHEKLKVTAEEAKQANSAKSVFLANMSHELRTPLNAIIGYSELIMDDPYSAINVSHRNDLKKITSAGRHLLQLINEVLDLSKIEAGKMEVIPVSIDLPHLLNELTSTIRPLAEQNKNKLIVECSPQVRQLYTDNMKVRQILINLLGNACKFTSNGIICLKAEPRSLHSVEHVVFSVSDTGTGISENLIDSLFEPFTQGDGSSTKNHGGTGLGLSICHRLSFLLGGEITVTSALGEGTTFVVTIPVDYTHRPTDKTSFDISGDDLVDNRKINNNSN